MSTEVEERIHRALAGQPLERIPEGYRLAHPGSVGVSTLRIVPVDPASGPVKAAAVAHIEAQYAPAALPAFHPAGVQRLNAMAVHGIYWRGENGILHQSAQFSIHRDEPGAHLAAQTILNAFGAQLPIGLSVALATASAEALERQRAHHEMPREWRTPVDPDPLRAASGLMREQRLAASHDDSTVWAELPLSGEVASRSVDPSAETAILQVDTKVRHPIAGVGYLATITLPLGVAADTAPEVCRRLNALELEHVDFVPRLGAWGLHGPDAVPAYSCFMPSVEPSASLPVSLLWWMAVRAAWLRERVWVAGRGLTLDALERR